MTFDLNGKVAFVTGSGVGIGFAAASLFAEQGARVTIAELNEETGQGAVERIRAAGGEAIHVRTDVSDDASVSAAVRQCVDAFGRLDILYNNAGGNRPRDGLVTEVDLDEFWKTLQVDLFGTVLCCRHAIPEMIRSGGGSVINTSSIVALLAWSSDHSYTAAKGAVTSLTRALALDYAPHNIRVNAVAPGVTRSERVIARLNSGTGRPKVLTRHLLGQCEPADIANMALFLASDASQRITGQIMSVDSGMTAT